MSQEPPDPIFEKAHQMALDTTAEYFSGLSSKIEKLGTNDQGSKLAAAVVLTADVAFLTVSTAIKALTQMTGASSVGQERQLLARTLWPMVVGFAEMLGEIHAKYDDPINRPIVALLETLMEYEHEYTLAKRRQKTD